jgi:hypothetical protein
MYGDNSFFDNVWVGDSAVQWAIHMQKDFNFY